MKTNNSTLQVYQQLKDKILHGEFANHQPLVESSVCDEFVVSRTPVREAFRMLAKDQLLILTPNKGAIVKSLSNTDVDHIFDLRCVLETWAVSEATRLIRDEDLEQLEQLIKKVDQLVQTNDKTHLHEINITSDRIHASISMVLDNRWYANILNSLKELTQLSKDLASQDEEQILRAHEDHRKIFLAMKARNAEEAARCMKEHILHAQFTVQKNRRILHV